MRNLYEFLRSSRKWIILFCLTVLLPALSLGLLAIRAFRGEESRKQFQRKERQLQILRFLESDLNNWLFSLQSRSEASEPILRFQIEGGQILFPDLNVVLSVSRFRQPLLSLSTVESRLWQEAQMMELHDSAGVGPRKARSAYLRLVNDQPRLASWARLAILRLLLQNKESKDAAAWMNSIWKNDNRAMTEFGIPIWVAAGLLLASQGQVCKQHENAPANAAEFLNGALRYLTQGQWRLTGAQWVLYADEISAALQTCLPQQHSDTVLRVQQLRGLLHSLIEIFPQILALPKGLGAGLPGGLSEKKYFSELKAFVVVFPGKERALGHIVGAPSLADLAERRLNELTAGDDFRGALINMSPQRAVADGVLLLPSFSPFQVGFTERKDSGSLLNFQKHFFLFVMVFLVLISILGLLFTYRAVSHEVEVSRLKSDFVSAVSHEFRSPLTSIQALLERLESGRVHDEETRARYLRVIGQELYRLTSLVNRVLDFARLEEGKKEFYREPHDLALLAGETVQSFHNLGYADRVTLSNTEKFRTLVVSADRTAIAQCIQNLIDNAIKYSPKDSPVIVQTGQENGEIFLEVSDQGPGIPVSEQAKIFEQFYRARHTDTHNVKGAGIGLALVKRTMEGHGGRVTVESRLGEGSKFRLIFPSAEKK